MTRRTAAIKAAIGLSMISTPAFANVFDTYGQSAGTIAIGNATTAGGTTAFAAYTNPALLPTAKRNEISAQAIMTRFDLQDLPEAANSPLPADQDRASNADDLEGNSVGMNFILAKGLHLGVAAYMPQGSFGRIKGVSSYQSTYLRYSENQGKPSIYTALGYQLPGGFSVGLGAYYSLRAKGVLQIALTNTESEGRVDLNMEPVVAPYGGLAWANEKMTVGLTYREAQKTDSKIDSGFSLTNEDFSLPFNANTSLVPFYDPAIFRFGYAYSFEDFQVLFSFEQAQWARFKTALVSLTGNDVASISAESNGSNANLRDTQAYRLGLILPFQGMNQNFEFRSGIEFHTSANRPNTRGSVVDPARQSLAAGLSWNVAVDESGRRLALETAYQYSQLSSLDRVSARGAEIHLKSGHSIQTFVGGLNYEL
jgi:long-subunit fatty acid transport protein